MKQLIRRLTEPAVSIPDERKLFSDHALKLLILPLFLEQLLEVLVGVSDTFMVSYAGEAAVSGVSLVNMFNTVFIFLFSALAAGGAVVVSQYIGSRDEKNGNLSAGQLVMIASVFSVAVMTLSLVLNRQLLRLLFGEVDQDVMEACVTYLRISAYSYPAIAVYNAGAAIYRSMGKTNVTMNISLAANGIEYGKDQRDHEYFPCSERDQYSGKCDRRICFPCGGGGSCLSVVDREDIFRSGHSGTLFPKGEA